MIKYKLTKEEIKKRVINTPEEYFCHYCNDVAKEECWVFHTEDIIQYNIGSTLYKGFKECEEWLENKVNELYNSKDNQIL